MTRRFPFSILALLFLVLGASWAHGVTFSWPTTPSFPTGPTPGNSASRFYSGLGTVTITNNADPSTGTGGSWQSGYPRVDNSTVTGGTSSNGFQLAMASQPTVNSNIKVQITFAYTGGVTNVSFTLWDVDAASNFTDKITAIYGVALDGSLVAATVTGSSNNTVTGSGTLNATVTGTGTASDNSSSGNVTISFGSAVIQSIQFVWSDANTSTRTTQAIAISPIVFTPLGTATPEIGTSLGSLVVCLGVVGYGRARRRRKTALPQ